MWTKSCLFQQLWTIFSTKIVKNPSISVTYFSSSFHFLHCHAVLLWPQFYNITYSCFNVANKMLLISKIIFFTPCFQNFLLSTIYFSRYLQFPLNTITYQENYVTEGFLLEDYGTWNWNFFIFAVFVFSTLDAFPKKTYEKTYCFYNIFKVHFKLYTFSHLYRLNIFFQKKCRLVQLNVHFSNFESLFQKTLWEDLLFLWHILKVPFVLYMLTNFGSLKYFAENVAAFWKC